MVTITSTSTSDLGILSPIDEFTQRLTDSQLSFEIRRRGLDDRPALAMELTDEQLRAECSRRGIGHVSEPMVTVRDHAEIIKRLDAECAEWKRRAEAAEPSAKSIEVYTAIQRDWRISFESGAGHVLIHENDGAKVWISPATFDRMAQMFCARPEPRPDNSVAWLDEDLLCDDA